MQSVAKIDDERGVKLTIAQYMTPSNKKIQAIGIKPDVEIEETDGDWVSQNRKESSIVREKDLKNHLTATVETPEEKVERERLERQDREVREQRLRELRDQRNKKVDTKQETISEDSEERRGDPEKDYQVNQAINYLNTISLIKNLKVEK